ncbi:MAG: glycosyltransferase family 2 protein [Chloroflexi bacterium]|nr:glycosyltransferase family 2 protein [Chloroflexota bacterium]
MLLTTSAPGTVPSTPPEPAAAGPERYPELGRILVIIPCYREAENVGGVISQLRSCIEADVLVIDDHSPDNTGEVAREAGATVVRHPINLGYGAAVQTGFKFAASHRYDIVVQMDGDGQHDPTCVSDLLDAVRDGDADVVIGSRFLGRAEYRVPTLRRLGMLVFGFVASAAIGRRVSDPTSGFQALRKDVVDFFATDVYPHDYPDADVIIMLHRAGFKTAEVPVRMFANPTNTSMHSGLIKPLYYVFKMALSILVTLLRQKRSPGGRP